MALKRRRASQIFPVLANRFAKLVSTFLSRVNPLGRQGFTRHIPGVLNCVNPRGMRVSCLLIFVLTEACLRLNPSDYVFPCEGDGCEADADAGPTCEGGTVSCGNTCVNTQMDPVNCGTCGNRCSAEAACQAGKCGTLPEDCSVSPCPSLGFYCDFSTNKCKPGCVADNQCGSSSKVCEKAARQCICATGFHECGAACVSDSSVNSCGASCTPCVVPLNASAATCVHGTCGFTCSEGFDVCGGSCCKSTPKWNQVNSGASNSPSARYNHAMVYDSSRNRVVLFGGYDNDGSLSDTWEMTWNGSSASWTQVNSGASNAPAVRSGHSMVYDASRNRVVLFGGGESNVFNDTWEYGL